MPRIYSTDDLRKLAAHPFVRRFDYYKEAPSTNDLAQRLAGQDHGETPLLVLAERQTAGRGRGENRWWSADGALTFSLLLSSADVPMSERPQPMISLIVGLAVCEALESLLGAEISIGLKWPNDVYLETRKVCGVLVEAPPRRLGKLVVGIGVNVTNSLLEAPEDLRDSAVSLCDVIQCPITPAEVLLALLDRLAERLPVIQEEADWSAQWGRFCLLSGRTVHLQIGSRQAEGLCKGIDRDGALLLRTDRGLERFFSGEITDYE